MYYRSPQIFQSQLQKELDFKISVSGIKNIIIQYLQKDITIFTIVQVDNNDNENRFSQVELYDPSLDALRLNRLDDGLVFRCLKQIYYINNNPIVATNTSIKIYVTCVSITEPILKHICPTCGILFVRESITPILLCKKDCLEMTTTCLALPNEQGEQGDHITLIHDSHWNWSYTNKEWFNPVNFHRNLTLDLIDVAKIHNAVSFGGFPLSLILQQQDQKDQKHQKTKNSKNIKDINNHDLDLLFHGVEDTIAFIRHLKELDYDVVDTSEASSGSPHRLLWNTTTRKKEKMFQYFKKMHVCRRYAPKFGITIDMVVPHCKGRQMITNDFEMNSLTYNGTTFGAVNNNFDDIVQDIKNRIIKFAPQALQTILNSDNEKSNDKDEKDEKDEIMSKESKESKECDCQDACDCADNRDSEEDDQDSKLVKNNVDDNIYHLKHRYRKLWYKLNTSMLKPWQLIIPPQYIDHQNFVKFFDSFDLRLSIKID